MKKRIHATTLRKQVVVMMNAEHWTEAIALLLSEYNFPVVRRNWRLSWELAWCYFKLDRLDQAEEHMIHASELASYNPTCLTGLAAIYLENGNPRKAETNSEKALRIRESYFNRCQLALALMMQGKISRAENVHLEAIKLKPRDGKRYEAYGDFLSDIGRDGLAQTMYRNARKLRKSKSQ
jgi:Flp pilus assembly protein TadD